MIDEINHNLILLRERNDNLGRVINNISSALQEFETISVREVHAYAFDGDSPKSQKVLVNIYQFFELLLQQGVQVLNSLNLIGAIIENQNLQTFHQCLNDASNCVLTIENWDDMLFKILLRILNKERSDESILSENEFAELKDGVIKQVLYLFRRRLVSFGLDANFTVRIMSDKRYREHLGHLIPLLVEL